MKKKNPKTFERSEEYLAKIFNDALDGEVHMDLELECVWNKGKPRVCHVALAKDSDHYARFNVTWVQFPNALRELDMTYIADVVKCGTKRKSFYRAYKGSIRDKAGNVIG